MPPSGPLGIGIYHYKLTESSNSHPWWWWVGGGVIHKPDFKTHTHTLKKYPSEKLKSRGNFLILKKQLRPILQNPTALLENRWPWQFSAGSLPSIISLVTTSRWVPT